MSTRSILRQTVLVMLTGVIVTINVQAQLFGLGGIRGSGKIVSDSRPVAAFSTIKVTSSGDVVFKQGATREVIIEADDNIWERVTTDVSSDGELALGLQSGSYNNIHLKFIITNPTLEGVQISGSGSVNVETPLETKKLVSNITGSGSLRFKGGTTPTHELSIQGSGSIDAEKVQADNVKVSISGSGDAKVYAAKSLTTQMYGSGSLDVDGVSDAKQIVSHTSGSGSIRFKGSGKAEQHDITIRGSGNVYADKLQSDNVSVEISGSGDANVIANKSLNARISASGNVNYRGDATNITKTIRGSGSVNKR